MKALTLGYDISPWITLLEFTVVKRNVQSSDKLFT